MRDIKNKLLVIFLIAILLSTFIFPILNSVYAATTYTQILKSGIENFPTEYQEALKQIKNLHKDWTFEAYYTGIDWDTVVLNETSTHGRNRIIKTADSVYKCSCGNIESGYACASEGIIKYYLDPRNFLNEVNIFQFLEISYNEKIHTLEGIKKTVKNTFLDNTITYTYNQEQFTKTYSEIILEAAKQSNMSPYSIVTKIIQEVGSKGSDSVSGTYTGYEGYYNFYNWGAYDSGNAIVNALLYAREQGWNNQYVAIIEGAKMLAKAYTNAGQNTAYFYKWDVVGTSILKSGQSVSVSSSDMYWHQYMTNVQDPTSQSKSLYNTYANNGVLNAGLNFIIPIYNNMPNSNSSMPTGFNENEGNLYTVSADTLRVRNTPSTSAAILTTVYKDMTVQVLERECANADGYTWDKVKLSNGITGYIASQYLVLKTNETTTNNNNASEENKGSKTLFKIEGENIIIAPGTTLDKIDSSAKGEIKTGGTIIIGEKTYTAIVKGDTNGDGKVGSADYVRIKNYMLNKIVLTEAQIKAADANNDKQIGSADYVRIKNYMLSKAIISI